MEDFPQVSHGNELLCSYCISGSQMIYQAIYTCDTCRSTGMTENTCCCAGCADVCHEGHDVTFLAFGRGYCDCGASDACTLINKSRMTLSDRAINLSEHMISSHQTHQLHRLKEQCCELVKFSKDTFWINSTASPSCLFEEYALNIFHYYCQDKADDPAGSGAEWWVQVKYDDIDKEAPDATEITIETNSNRSNGIDLHYDKDEEIGELFGIGIFPQISTVTYLSSREHDIPTLIVDNLTSSPVGSPIKHAYISEPIFGKHISFDGRYLHGAPVQLKNLFMKSLERNPAEPRVTFLVNIWLNYHPVKVQPIPQSILKLINTPSYIPITSFDLQSCDDIKTIKVNPADVNDDDDVGEWYKIPFISNKSSWGKDEDETGLYLKLWLPYRISSFISKSSKSPTKKKDTAKVDRDGGGTEVHTTSWMLEYTKTSCASLEYETDEEFIEDMEEGMDL